MTIATDAFNGLYTSLAEARCQIRIGRTVIAKALCAGIGINRENSERGQSGAVDATVRLLTSDEPGGAITNGTVIEILQSGATKWIDARVGGRYTVGGLTRLMIEAVNE